MKLVAIDMDGTLLHSEKYISTYTSEVIQRLQREGHYFVIATGRALEDAKNIVTEASIPADAYICANGAIIADHTGKMLREEHLDLQVASDIASWLNERGYYFHLATSDGIYATDEAYQFFLNELEDFALTQDDGEHIKVGIRDQADQQLKYMGIKMLPSPADIPSYDFTTYKFLVLSLFQSRLQTIREAFEDHNDIAITSSGRNNLELMPINASKGSGLAFIANHLGISEENTIAIGDNYNDLSMFESAGFSIAMENAEPEVKQYVHTETGENDADGVATAIEKHILTARQ